MMKPRWFSSFVAEDTQPSVISIQARHTHLLSVTHPLFPQYLLLLVPADVADSFSVSQPDTREKKNKPNSDSNLSDDSLHMCHLVVSSGKRSTSSTRACLHCAAGRCRFLCDLRGRLTGALQRRLRKRKRLNENVV